MSTRPSAGYSGTPLARKLGLSAGMRIVLVDTPEDYATFTGFDLGACRVLGQIDAFDFAHAFVRSRAALASALDALAPHLEDRGMIWISWLKRASGIATDLTEDGVRELALPLGLVDVKVCAVDAIWSGLKLVRRVELRRGQPPRP